MFRRLRELIDLYRDGDDAHIAVRAVEQPHGTVAFLSSDVEGLTQLLQNREASGYADARSRNIVLSAVRALASLAPGWNVLATRSTLDW